MYYQTIREVERSRRTWANQPFRLSLRTALLFALTFAIFSLFHGRAAAANPSGDLRIEPIAAYNFVVDSNVESPSTYAPEAAHIGAKFCNDGANDLTDAFAYVGNFDEVGSDHTPAIYPSRSHLSLAGTFSLTHEGGAADGTRYVGTIPAGECVTQFWLVSYPTLDDNGNAVHGPSVKPDDDLWLEYDIWGTADDGATPLTANVTRTATMRNEISAMANKIWPNGDNKVPQAYKDALDEFLGWDTATDSGNESAYPGETLTTKGIWYDLGNVGKGFDNDGDLVPDQNLWMQPVGDAASYDASCFRLVSTYGIVIVKLKSGGELLIPFEDQLYFSNIPDNTGAVGLVFYRFLALNGPCTAAMSPYQEVASGSDNEKFNGDYGHYVPPLVSLAPVVDFDKSANVQSVGPSLPATIDYTIAFTNSSSIDLGKPDLGIPLVVQETIPISSSYVAGSASANVNINGGAIGTTILYSSDNGASWSSTEPSPASDVTHIQWWLDEALPIGATGSVGVQVTVNAAGGPFVDNRAGLSFGAGNSFVEDQELTLVLGTNSIGDRVWQDDDNDGTDDGGTEPVLPNVTLQLYWDSNGDGILSSADVLITTAETDVNGDYTFSSLPDADYLVQIDMSDSDVPPGYKTTTASIIAVTGLSGGTAHTSADFGLGPPLSISKSSVTSPILEGQNVLYNIVLTNNRESGTGTPCQITTWASTQASQSDGKWVNRPNAFGANELDALYASSDFQAGTETIGGTGFNVGGQSGGIVAVEALFSAYLGGDGAISNDKVDVRLYFNNDGTPLATHSYTISEINALGPDQAAQDLLVWDVTSVRTWSWSDFSGNLDLIVITDKTGSDDNAVLYLDAIGFRITTDETCGGNTANIMATVPLSDSYNADLFQFVAASPAETRISTSTSPYANTGVLSWDNVGPIDGQQSKTITVTFKALEPAGNVATTVTNTATSSGTLFLDGSTANLVTDDDIGSLTPTGSISGTIWSEGSGTSGWVNPNGYEAGTDLFIPEVAVNLYACLDVNGDLIYPGNVNNRCENNFNDGFWTLVGSQVTNANGDYLFEGLEDGYYYVAVDTATLPGTPTQTGDPDETPGVCSTCDSLWGDPLADLSALGSVANASDTTEINFGYDIQPAVYGTLWEDSDGDGVQDALESGISGVTVELTHAGCTVSVNCPTATTDAEGHYQFGNLTAGTAYTILVQQSTLPAGDPWNQTGESDGTVNNSIAVTPAAGEVSGSHDFGFQQSGTAAIGDTLYFDWNGNGIQNTADEGIAGITLSLYRDVNANGAYDSATDTFITTTVTSNDGTYQFSNLAAGNYLVLVDETDPDFPSSVTRTADPDESGVTCAVCDGMGSVLGLSTGVVTTTIDFGYQPFGSVSIGDTIWYDRNGDGIQAGALETGLANITVEMWVDANSDGNYTLIQSTSTDAAGNYLFDSLPDGSFNSLPAGTYKIVIDTEDADLPTDPFGNSYVPTTNVTHTVVVESSAVTSINGNSCSSCDLDVDFGLAAFAAIGDLIFWDANGNGEPDWNEARIADVQVTLTNSGTITTADGTVWPDGTYVLTTTTSDGTDGNAVGSYLFSGLPPGDYTISVDTSGPIGGASQTADPDRDGVTCSDNTYPSLPLCDSAYTTTLNYGTSFMGADFGYQPPGAFGDLIWFDQDGDGVQDAGEPGMADLLVTAVNGATTLTTTTDLDGYYSFANLADGTWTVTFEQPASYTPTSGPDSVGSTGVSVVVSGGAVTSIGGTGCSDCELDVDLGYELSGIHALSGTLCIDDPAEDGLCDIDASGVLTTETAFEGATVYLYSWTDAGVLGVVEAGETAYLGATTTNANGDYSFANLPADDYIVSIQAPTDFISLTTTVADTAASLLVDNRDADNNTTSAYQAVTVSGAVTNIDFAFAWTQDMDFGDLPNTYGITSFADNGARHIQPSTPNLHLGISPDTEDTGYASVNADGDDTNPASPDDEDGVAAISPSTWVDGVNGGSVFVSVTGNGWLVGWMDFNDDVDFGDSGELIVSQLVSTGSYTVTFDIPAGTISGGNSDFYSRFRLLEAEPPLPALSFSGSSSNGEVEDYLFSVGSNTGIVDGYLYIDVDADGTFSITVDTPISSVNVVITDTLGVTYTVATNASGYFSQTVNAGSTTVDVEDADPDMPAYLSLTAGSSDPTTVTVPTNGSATDNTGYVQPIGQLSVSKTIISPTVGVASTGDPVIYTLNILNSGQITVAELTLSDSYNSQYLQFSSASITPTLSSTGAITWTGTITGGTLQPHLPIIPGNSFTVTVQFVATEP